ncbi:MAG: cbb3-type cytochrome c oxidase subunit 3 [Rhizobiales bacterium]|nr:cbb3-type cytochrome c oxidase subunit 3 [Hyphomicrobiales bacterium]
MDLDYHSMRTFADSWGLLFMFLTFVLVIWMALRPSAKKSHEDAANIPFKE